MAQNYKKQKDGFTVVPKTSTASDSKGELEVIDSTGKLNYHNGTTNSPVVTESHSATLTNKTFDANGTGNTLSNVETADLAAGVLNTSTSLAGATDAQVPSALAAKTYVDNSVGAVQTDVNDLVTLSGVAANATDLGTFTGATIPDNSDNKEAFQALETAVEGKLGTSLTSANIFVGNGSNIATGVAVSGDVTLSNTGDIQIATGVIVNNDINAAAAIDATKIADGSVTNTEFQYINTLTSNAQTQIDGKVTGPGSATDNAITRYDGTTGKLVQNSGVTISDLNGITGVSDLSASGMVDAGTILVNSVLRETITADSSTTGANATVAPTTSIVRLSNASLSSIDMISSPTAGKNVTLINQTGATITINNDTGGTAANRIFTGTGSNLTLSDQASLLLKYDDTESRWMVIGGTGSGSSSGINYITNGTAEAGTTGWATYADAAGTSPVDGTGGAPSVTLAASSSSPLRGTNSFLFTKDAANRQGQGVSYAFSIDRADMAQVLRISFNYETSTNYVDTVSGNLVNSDMQVFVYDVTNSVLISVVEQNIGATTVEGLYVGSFQASSNSQSYRLILHVASTNANSYTLKFDNVIVGPQTLVKGPIVTDSTQYTANTNGFGTVSSVSTFWSRNGDKISIQGKFIAGTVAASEARIYFPTGTVIKSSFVTGSSKVKGKWWRDNATANTRKTGTLTIDTTSAAGGYAIFTSDDYVTANTPANGLNGSSVAASSDAIYFELYDVPVQGWSSNVVLSEDSGNRLITCRACRTTNQAVATTAVTTIVFDSAPVDTTASFNTSTGTWTCPESGYYVVNTQVMVQGLASGDNYILRMRKNGADIAQENIPTITTDNNQTHTINRIEYLVKGDTITVLSDSGADASYTITGTTAPESTWLSIYKLSTPQTLAGSETVAVRVVQTSGQSITSGSDNTVTWDASKQIDTHNAIVSATGIFTCPVSGNYSVVATIGYPSTSWTAGQTTYNILYKNGGIVAYSPVNPIDATVTGSRGTELSTTLPLVKGDTLILKTFQDRGSSTALSTSAGINYMSINLIK